MDSKEEMSDALTYALKNMEALELELQTGKITIEEATLKTRLLMPSPSEKAN